MVRFGRQPVCVTVGGTVLFVFLPCLSFPPHQIQNCVLGLSAIVLVVQSEKIPLYACEQLLQTLHYCTVYASIQCVK